MNKFFLLFIFIAINMSAQINYQFLTQDWTKTRIRMLDGSKDLSEPYLSTKFYQWKISGNKLCMHSDPIFFNTNLCINYILEKNFIRTSPKTGYEIEKLTKDSLIVIERLDGDAGIDKIKKLRFVKTFDIKKNWIENTKTDSVLIANEHFTPTLNKNFIVEINQKFAKLNRYPNFDLIGNIVFYPKKQRIELDITNINEISKHEKYVEIQKTVIEASYSSWDLKDFMHFDRVYLPFIIKSQSYSVDENYTFRGAQIFYFTNDIKDIPKIMGIRPEKIQEARKNFNDGITAFQSKKNDAAILYFEKSYELDNRNVDALYNIVAIYSLKNNNAEICKNLKLLSDLEQTEGIRLYNQNCKKQ